MTGPGKRTQWVIDEPDLPQSINTKDAFTTVPSGDKVSVSAFVTAAIYMLLETLPERGFRYADELDYSTRRWVIPDHPAQTSRSSATY
jgi:hypothetical protein